MRFAATKLVEGDPRIEEALKLDQNEKEMIEHIILQMEQERGLDRAAAIADMRFHFIHQLVNQTVVKPHQSKEQLRSARIDRFLTGNIRRFRRSWASWRWCSICLRRDRRGAARPAGTGALRI